MDPFKNTTIIGPNQIHFLFAFNYNLRCSYMCSVCVNRVKNKVSSQKVFTK